MILAVSTVWGSSAVNWSASFRTSASLLEEWSVDDKIPLFGSADYKSAMDAIWERVGVTENCTEEGFQNQVLRKGCSNLGLKVATVPRNSPKRHYCGSCCYECRTGEKRGMDSAWLVDAVEHGVVILIGCKADKLILEMDVHKGTKKQCSGVKAMVLNENITWCLHIKAKATVSACGSILTPPQLISNGSKNPHIGRNLHFHPAQMVWAYFPENSTTASIDGMCYKEGIITAMHKVIAEDTGGVQAIVEIPALGPASFAELFPWISGADMKKAMVRDEST